MAFWRVARTRPAEEKVTVEEEERGREGGGREVRVGGGRFRVERKEAVREVRRESSEREEESLEEVRDRRVRVSGVEDEEREGRCLRGCQVRPKVERRVGAVGLGRDLVEGGGRRERGVPWAGEKKERAWRERRVREEVEEGRLREERKEREAGKERGGEGGGGGGGRF